MEAAPTPISPLAYPRPSGVFDEVYGAGESVSEHWQYLLNGLQALGPEELAERERKALRDDGASYNVFSDRESTGVLQGSHTWSLDPVLLLITSEEWGAIESGLLERAELLNLLLKDLYHDRELIRHRVIPPELLFSHPGFLRQCQGISLSGEHQRINYAADMVRTEQGGFCVIGDRAQAPSGASYALENRTVMSRILPSLFRDSQVHRLSLFFSALRRKLNELGPGGDTPRVVVLTPGTYNETYFERAYLANYLGYPLVQGGDLTVRNGSVWMKSVGGLSRVDVILRRVDDFFCDPVELKGSSRIGVRGLLEAARAGKVVLANPLGSGALENQGLLRYLPAISKFYLGREPRLPSVRTWWCGDPDDLAYVVSHIPNLVIKACWRRAGTFSVVGGDLSASEQATCIAMLRKQPTQYVAQEYLRPAFLPAWQSGRLSPRPSVLRSFAVASESSYTVMPGGLTRVGKERASKLVTNQLGSSSKDTWVLASEPEKQLSLQSIGARYDRTEGQGRSELPSRVVENMFWMGRYSERAESALRLLRTVFMQLNGVDGVPADFYPLVLPTVTHVTSTFPGFTAAKRDMLARPEPELLSVILDGRRVGSVSASLTAMLEAAEQVKELLSADTQRIINDIRDQIDDLQQALSQGIGSAPEEALDPLVTSLLALAGLTQESMIRGPGWRFLKMGRQLERAMQTAALLRSLLVPAYADYRQEMLLNTVLLSVEALITYRRRYRDSTDLAGGLELLLLEGTNPRSLIYQLTELEHHVHALENYDGDPSRSAESRYLLEARTALQLCDLEVIATADSETQRRLALDSLFLRAQDLLQRSAGAIADRYFDHTEGPQPLLRGAWEDLV